MRDFLLDEALRRLATEAATRFNALVAGGDQVPFDVAAASGEEVAFYSYVPLTGRYVEERAGELRSLPSFASAREAIAAAGVAAGYLEARGEAVPADPSARAERMLTVFVAALWEGSGEFSLDRDRLETALRTLDAEVRGADDAELVMVPLVGLRMSSARLQLPHGVRVVRADSLDAPVEAMRSEGMGRAAWEPQFLAVADQDPDGGAESALRQLRELISVMRLFKGGGLGLGPYAFAPTGEGCWRRIATGAPAARPGGYRLGEAEATALGELASALEARPDPDSALAWAVGRFEMGCERGSALEGLSDHLLALRAVLEGHGPVGASLPLRAAALLAGDSLDRVETRARVEDVLELERALMAGRPSERAVELATWVEDGVRGLLRRAALGELGSDLSAAADETLVVTGLESGDAQIAIFAEEPDAAPEDAPADAPRAGDGRGEAPRRDSFIVRAVDDELASLRGAPAPGTRPDVDVVSPSQVSPGMRPDVDVAQPSQNSPGTPGREAEDVPADETSPSSGADRYLILSGSDEGPAAHLPSQPSQPSQPPEEEDRMDQDTRIMEPIPAEDEIRITATPWLDEVSDARSGESLEWPAAPARDVRHRERVDTPRVRHLFPIPEDADWEVTKLEFEYDRRAG